ncbi:MAG TPA: sigma 54-interacting transcriptional regulator [Candidatus Solibacter sp.]|nr:sigma 54-interacting transcriptional regulator [Candidatus Solibacter sp.]
MSVRVILLDLEGGAKCELCRNLPHWIENAIAGLSVKFERVRRWQDAEILGATIVVRCSSATAPEIVKLQQSASLAFICQPPAGANELLDVLPPGIDDFLCCPCEERDFSVRLRRLLLMRTSMPRLDQLIGKSPAFLEAVGRVGLVARSHAPVLLQGETGVGKELFSRAIHYSSLRESGPFVPLNCSGLPENLFENELFGHVKGAFTDARTNETGLLGEANGGTLFLDEVDMLAPMSQAKLLRFLQDHRYRQLGSSKTLLADVRIIAASNTCLADLVRDRQFRQDLFHRLNVLPLSIPPLRDRHGDIPLLADHFALRFAPQYGRSRIRFSPRAFSKMASYSWPGNVRELEGVIHRAIVFGSSPVLDAAALDIGITVATARAQVRDGKDVAMLEFERAYLTNLLSEHGGNLSQSAAASGKNRRTLQRLLRKHGIQRMSFQSTSWA